MPATGRKSINVYLLGDARIEAPGGTITPSASVVFALGLMLTLDRDKQPSRRHIEALLWPSVDSSMRSHRLRQALSRLRAIGFEVQDDKTKVIVGNPITID